MTRQLIVVLGYYYLMNKNIIDMIVYNIVIKTLRKNILNLHIVPKFIKLIENLIF